MRMTVLGGGGAWPTTERGCSGYLIEEADHCADLNPLLRARHLSDDPPPALPVYALPSAVDAVLALDEQMLAEDCVLHAFAAGDGLTIGPFRLATRSLPHFVPNVGVRLSVGDVAIAYTGDGGASPDVADLAAGAQLLPAEATYAEQVPKDSRGSLGSARLAGEHATAAQVGQLVLTHLWPDTDLAAAERAARQTFSGPVTVAVPGLTVDLT